MFHYFIIGTWYLIQEHSNTKYFYTIGDQKAGIYFCQRIGSAFQVRIVVSRLGTMFQVAALCDILYL